MCTQWPLHRTFDPETGRLKVLSYLRNAKVGGSGKNSAVWRVAVSTLLCTYGPMELWGCGPMDLWVYGHIVCMALWTYGCMHCSNTCWDLSQNCWRQFRYCSNTCRGCPDLAQNRWRQFQCYLNTLPISIYAELTEVFPHSWDISSLVTSISVTYFKVGLWTRDTKKYIGLLWTRMWLTTNYLLPLLL
jgi:hypothetical protein